MTTDKMQALAAAKDRVAQLEQELSRELAGLPAQFGFNDTASFVAAVKAAVGRRRGRKPGRSKGLTAAGAPRKRARITDDTRTAVRKLVEQKKTGAEIARQLRISLPSVQNIKKALGLVRPKKSK